MKKIYIFLGLCVSFCFEVQAQYVSTDTALQVAENFFASRLSSKSKMSMQIDISRFPLGIYIIRAVTKDGQILQTKIIHK